MIVFPQHYKVHWPCEPSIQTFSLIWDYGESEIHVFDGPTQTMFSHVHVHVYWLL